MITLPILILAIVLFAWKEALDDARAIAESNKTKKPFTHDDPDRYIVAGVFTLIMAGFAQTWWALLYFPVTWAVFTISFRFLLNRKRGMDWRYISPSNVYDRLWITAGWSMKYVRILFSLAVWEMFNSGHENDIHRTDYAASNRYRTAIHRAGTIAYCFEGLVLLTSITIYITKTL